MGEMQRKWIGIRMERSASESSSSPLSTGLGLKVMKKYLIQKANSTQGAAKIIWNKVRLNFKTSQVFCQTVVPVSCHISLQFSINDANSKAINLY